MYCRKILQVHVTVQRHAPTVLASVCVPCDRPATCLKCFQAKVRVIMCVILRVYQVQQCRWPFFKTCGVQDGAGGVSVFAGLIEQSMTRSASVKASRSSFLLLFITELWK